MKHIHFTSLLGTKLFESERTTLFNQYYADPSNGDS